MTHAYVPPFQRGRSGDAVIHRARGKSLSLRERRLRVRSARAKPATAGTPVASHTARDAHGQARSAGEMVTIPADALRPQVLLIRITAAANASGARTAPAPVSGRVPERR